MALVVNQPIKRARVLQEMLKILAEHPDGLQRKELDKIVRTSGVLGSQAVIDEDRGITDAVTWMSVAPAAAGWISKKGGIWRIEQGGRDALAKFADSDELRQEAQRLYREARAREKGQGFDVENRDDPEAAERLFEELYPIEAERQIAMTRLVGSIEEAERQRPGCWTVTAFSNRIRLNVGRLAVLDLLPSEIVVVVDADVVTAEVRKSLEPTTTFRSWQSTRFPLLGAVTKPASLEQVLQLIGAGHTRAIELSANTASVGYAASHSPGITQWLRESGGLTAPEPAVRSGPPAKLSFDEAVGAWDHEGQADLLKEAEAKRAALVKAFPLAEWPSLPLERYALGQADSSNSFCYALEYGTPELGSIKGGSAHKTLVFYSSSNATWQYPKAYSSVEEAWQAIRSGFVTALEHVADGDLEAADKAPALESAPAVRTKTLFIYFPERLLPIFSTAHLQHFLRLLGQDEPVTGTASASVRLLDRLRQNGVCAGWSTVELMHFLYWWADPRQSRQVVKVAPGEQGRLWQRCVDNAEIAVGWDEVGDLNRYESEAELRAAMASRYGTEWNNNQSTATLKTRELWTLRSLQPGDIVVANRGTSYVLGVGTVVEPGYVWEPDRSEYKHTVKVEWSPDTETAIPAVPKWATVTVAKVPADLFEKIQSAAKAPVVTSATASDPILQDIADQLERKGQVILFGPPGTGKTYYAQMFSRWWLLNRLGQPEKAAAALQGRMSEELDQQLISSGHLVRTTFHPAYAYEDFIEGFRPKPTEGRGGLELKLTDGIFKKLCDSALKNPEQPYLLIIDEINRGNVPRIFGELLTLLEKDKRGQAVTLPQGGSFSVPANVYVIGTMNTADRSIRTLDTALRRRFGFKELLPDPERLSGGTIGSLDLGKFLEGLNAKLRKLGWRDRQIGHSYFLRGSQPISDPDEFATTLRSEVIPLLQEYAYDNYGLLRDLLGDKLIDVEAQELLDLDADAMAEALADHYQKDAGDAEL